MLNWLKRRRSRDELPEYAAIRRTPTRRLPSDLAEREASQAFDVQCEVIQRSLGEPLQRPQEQSPLFVGLLPANQRGVVTMTLPDLNSPCLLIFSTPIRAADYVQTLLARGPVVKYISSSPFEFVGMLRHLKGMGIEHFALDRCPRCNIVTVIDCASITTADIAINCWCISKATELARLDLYLSHAQASARAGQLEAAREVVLETIAHVSLEDPRAHLLLGQIAIALQDRPMLHEAKTFLAFFKLPLWELRLAEADRSGAPDFALTA